MSTSFAQCDGEMFVNSSRENCSCSATFDGYHRWTEIFKSRHKWSIGFKSGLWLDHSRTFILFLFSHSSVAVALCFRSLSCWNVNLLTRFRFMANWSRFSSRIIIYFVPYIVPSLLTSLPVPADEKQLHNMMLPPPYLPGWCWLGDVQCSACADITLWM